MIDVHPTITRSPDHQYSYEGKTYPGVTGILKVLDKSGPLMAWAARMTAEAAIGMLEVLPQVIATSGPEGAVKALTARSAWKNDEAKMLGTDVHGMAELVATGKPLPEMAPAVLERVKHYAEWWQASGWTIRATEALLVNPRVGYGGTLDLLCRDRDGRTVLADIKTGKGVYQETSLQLAAYGMAELIQANGMVFDMPPVDRYAVIHVTGTGVREIEMVVGDMERDAFGCCLGLSRWTETQKGKRL